MCRHRGRNLAPSRECLSFVLWCGQRCNGCTESHVLTMVSHPVHLVRKLVAVDLVLCGIGCIVRRDSLVYISPSYKCMSFLRRSLWGDYRCAVFHLFFRNDLAVSDECHLVLVGDVWAVIGNIVCRNGFVHVSEAWECVAFLLVDGRNHNLRTISLWLFIDDLSVNDKLDHVWVIRERTSNPHVVCRHRCRNLAPSRECLSFFLWCSQRSNGCAEGNFLTMICHSVNLVRQLVAVHLVLCGIGCIVRRDSLVYILPANKCMSFLRRSLWSDYWCAIFHLCLRNDLSVSNECHLVLVCNVWAINCYIVSWHRRWQIFPSRKGISFFCWNFFGNNTTSCR